jgi:hypothetical protein
MAPGRHAPPFRTGRTPVNRATGRDGKAGRTAVNRVPSNLAILAALLAVAALVHQATKLTLVASLPATLVTASAMLLLARPGWVPSLLLFATSQLLMLAAHEPPSVDNHWLLVGAVNVGVLSSAVSAARQAGALPRDAAELAPFALPLVRASVLAVYGLSVLHKLNTGFLEPSASCAGALYRVLALRGPLPGGDGIATAAIYGTLLAEVAIPVCLIGRRLRSVGLALGLLFHYVLGLADFYNFSLTMLALYAAFLPAGFAGQLDALWRDRVAPRRARVAVAIGLGAWLVLALGLCAVLAARGRPLALPRLAHASGYALWILYGPLIALGYSVVTARGAPHLGHGSLRLVPRRRWHAVAIALVLLNGLAPYLGLKTEAAFSMYSNLRTEGAYWNHLVVPSWVRVFPYQEDLVRIDASSEPALRRYHERGELLVAAEFARLVGAVCREGGRPVAVEYVHGGTRHAVPDACALPAPSTRPGGWAHRFLVFRPVTADCRH